MIKTDNDDKGYCHFVIHIMEKINIYIYTAISFGLLSCLVSRRRISGVFFFLLIKWCVRHNRATANCIRYWEVERGRRLFVPGCRHYSSNIDNSLVQWSSCLPRACAFTNRVQVSRCALLLFSVIYPFDETVQIQDFLTFFIVIMSSSSSRVPRYGWKIDFDHIFPDLRKASYIPRIKQIIQLLPLIIR